MEERYGKQVRTESQCVAPTALGDDYEPCSQRLRAGLTTGAPMALVDSGYRRDILTFFDEYAMVVLFAGKARPLARKNKSARSNGVCCRTATSPKLGRGRAREYARWFKALADPTRIRILNLLAANRDPVCVCDIVKHFPIGQPTISHHLKILRATRFVLSERHGTFMYYRVNRNCLGEFPHAARLIMDI